MEKITELLADNLAGASASIRRERAEYVITALTAAGYEIRPAIPATHVVVLVGDLTSLNALAFNVDSYENTDLHGRIDTLLAAVETKGYWPFSAIPDTHIVVPREPTEEMVMGAHGLIAGNIRLAEVYRAMTAVAEAGE